MSTEMVDSTPSQAPPKTESPSRGRRRQLIVPAVVTAFVLVLALTTDGFFTPGNANAILTTASVVGIAAVGMTAITLSGNFVSLGTQPLAVLASVVFLRVVGDWNTLTAVAVVLLLLAAIGGLQGLIVALGLNPVIVTLAAGAIVYGTLASVTGGRLTTQGAATSVLLNNPSIVGVPLSVWLFGAVTALATWLVSRTRVGRQVLLVGSNRDTATLSGLNSGRLTVLCFVFFGLGVGIAGIVYAGQLGQVSATDLPRLTTDVIAAVLVGGTAISGGSGSPLRSALGAIIVATFNNVMVLNGFEPGMRLLLTGFLIAAVVVLVSRLSTGQED